MNSCLHFVENLFSRDKKRGKNKTLAEQNIYHERQVKELCALHALNNLFQDRNAFSKQMLDNICHSLSPDNLVNPHKSMLGLGNYDVNVLMAALQQKGYAAIWFDKRKDPGNIDFSKIIGLILNIPSEMKFLPLPLNRKHWIAVKQIGNSFYNLDSKLDSPHAIGKESELLSYLREQIRCKDREIFVVVSQEVEQNSVWKKDCKHSMETSTIQTVPKSVVSRVPSNSTVAVIHLNSCRERTNISHRNSVNDGSSCLTSSTDVIERLEC